MIDYFYTHVSPWAYLGHQAFVDLAAAHGQEVRFRPVNLAGVFEVSGGLPLAKRHPVRQAYRFVELQRWREKRGVPLTLKPAFFPANPTLADCCAIAVAEAGGPVAACSARLFRAIWVEDLNIADEAVLAGLMRELGLDADALLEAAGSAAIQEAYQENQRRAIELGVIGSPCYVLKGEPFWGQDRLDLLEDALVSGRDAFRPV
ncbi:2-hydroxychromene-2-carboxylate isomerase [Pannonibacter indicus]|uniref:2-hydroxychromene-2-carboxylate isomerase n=1 Tax=Pannonibacter indicus TaxID=466044 RepID=UPI0035B4CF18